MKGVTCEGKVLQEWKTAVIGYMVIGSLLLSSLSESWGGSPFSGPLSVCLSVHAQIPSLFVPGFHG